MIDESIFKSYDVRGVYGTQLTEEATKCIGRAFAHYLGAQTIAVRAESETLLNDKYTELTALFGS